MMTCARCGADDQQNMFCGACGKVLDRAALQRVRLMGAVGLRHTSSPTVERFFQTGDPSVFTTPAQ